MEKLYQVQMGIYFNPTKLLVDPGVYLLVNQQSNIPIFNRKYTFNLRGSIFQPAILVDPGVYSSLFFTRGHSTTHIIEGSNSAISYKLMVNLRYFPYNGALFGLPPGKLTCPYF